MFYQPIIMQSLAVQNISDNVTITGDVHGGGEGVQH